MFKALALTFAMVASSAAHAAVIDWSATLSGGNELPIVNSLGAGSAFGTLDTTTNLLTWNITYSGLTNVVAMHFHEAPATANGPVVVNIGAISGLGSPSIGSTTVTDAQEGTILSGGWYINVHTQSYPGGEIRGQVEVSPVPLPGAMGLTLAGLGSLLAFRRRRRA